MRIVITLTLGAAARRHQGADSRQRARFFACRVHEQDRVVEQQRDSRLGTVAALTPSRVRHCTICLKQPVPQPLYARAHLRSHQAETPAGRAEALQ